MIGFWGLRVLFLNEVDEDIADGEGVAVRDQDEPPPKLLLTVSPLKQVAMVRVQAIPFEFGQV